MKKLLTFLVLCVLIDIYSESGFAAGVVQNESPQYITKFDTNGDTIRVMSFNVRYGTANDGDNCWKNRCDMLYKFIAMQGADIIGLQEALDFQVEQISKAVGGYEYVSVGRDDGKKKGEHCSVFYRKNRFNLVKTDTFWLSETPGVVASTSWGNQITRICTWAELIEKESGRTLFVFNAHMDHQSQRSRYEGAKLIANKIAEIAGDWPVVLMGDFNMALDNEAMAYLLGDDSPVKLVDTWKTLNPDKLDLRTWHDFKGGVEGKKIDHILVRPGTKILEADIDRYNEKGRYPSDHYPVTAMLKLW